MTTQALEPSRVVDVHADQAVHHDRLRRAVARRRAAGLVESLRSRISRNAVIELTVFAVLAVGYNIVRSAPGTNASLALDHARDIVAAEGFLFSHLEVALNDWMLGVTPVAVVACYMYALLHYVATPTIFFLSRRRGGWLYWRGYWALVVASGIALICYGLYPAAPPRLTPDLGVTDLMSQFSGYGWWGSAASAPRGIGDATNQYAAMPSMHCGWALWCGIQMWGFKSRVWRVMAVAYPTVLVIVVLGTGNHYLLDAVAGAACVGAAYGAVAVIGRAVGRAPAKTCMDERAHPSPVAATPRPATSELNA